MGGVASRPGRLRLAFNAADSGAAEAAFAPGAPEWFARRRARPARVRPGTASGCGSVRKTALANTPLSAERESLRVLARTRLGWRYLAQFARSRSRRRAFAGALGACREARRLWTRNARHRRTEAGVGERQGRCGQGRGVGCGV